MKHIRKAIVIGGGIAGPVTAMALQKAGIEATVYEAYASTADGVGGMLGLAPNGFDALAAIDSTTRYAGSPSRCPQWWCTAGRASH
jgi:2-polyprenyl-6-methoxyphenol hydroxylase-like FAD-dependent oxidoreductase